MKTYNQFVEDYSDKIAQLRQKQQERLRLSQEKLNAQRQQHQQFVDQMNREREEKVERKKLKDEIKKEIEDENT